MNPRGRLRLKLIAGTLESQALTQYPLPRRETVPSMAISAGEAPVAP